MTIIKHCAAQASETHPGMPATRLASRLSQPTLHQLSTPSYLSRFPLPSRRALLSHPYISQVRLLTCPSSNLVVRTAGLLQAQTSPGFEEAMAEMDGQMKRL